MKGNFVHTIIKSLLCLAIFIALIGTTYAKAPPTNLIGSWICEVDETVAFLVNFNQGGTFTASGPDVTTSVNYGEWKRRGLKTFESKDRAFIYDQNGTAAFIQETDASITMSDNDNLSADLEITIYDLDGIVIQGDSVTTTCTRTKI